MGHYQHLSIIERESAMVLLSQGLSLRNIAIELKRSVSTLSRELKRNSFKGYYSASSADKAYHRRRKNCCRQNLFNDSELCSYVQERLKLKWSPEQIEQRARLEGYTKSFSYNSIYRAIKQGFLDKSLKKDLRFKGKYHKRNPLETRGKLVDTISIHKRPKYIDKRKSLGHWESDTVFGQRKTGLFGTHVERKSGYLIAIKLKDRFSETFNAKSKEAFLKIPEKYRKSFTVDNGKEFSGHKELSESLNAKIYFCDKGCPWQRGSNENTNGLLRQYFPKRTSFAGITQKFLDEAVDLINNRPRKRLGFRTPAEVFLKL